MNKAITAIVTATVTVAFLALALPATSQAQNVNDHLKCYKIKDSHKYSAVADLITNYEQSMYPSEAGCKIQVKSKEFCLPVNKDRIMQPNNKRDAPHEDVVGQDLTNDFLCYKVRCPKDPAGVMPPSAQDVVDQFGERVIGGFRTTKMCTPAWKVFDNNDLPDLIPVPSPLTGSFCMRDTAAANLLVTVENQGAAGAGPTQVSVEFQTATGPVTNSVSVPALGAGVSTSVAVPFPVSPNWCYQPNCQFKITVDSTGIEVESNETNNVANDFCLG
jgi:hypothetical protein